MFHSIITIEDAYQQASEVEYELKIARAIQLPPRTQVNQQVVSNPKVADISQPLRD